VSAVTDKLHLREYNLWMQGAWKRELRELEEAQHGAFERSQALALGVPPTQLKRLTAYGELERMDPRTYRRAGSPQSLKQAVMLATLRTRGVACGRTAASLWGIPGFPLREREIEVVIRVPRRAPRLLGVTVRRTTHLPDEDVHVVDGIPVVSPARTLLMLGATESVSVVRRAVTWCIQRDLVTPEQLRDELNRVGRCGRNGTGGLRAAMEGLDFGQEMSDSDLEDIALSTLARAGYPEPLLHHEYHDVGVMIGEIDFFWPDRALGLECYGWEYHSRKPDFHRGFHRHNSLVASGVTLVYFTSDSARNPRRFMADFKRTWAGSTHFVCA
jgi:hypothetical protein